MLQVGLVSYSRNTLGEKKGQEKVYCVVWQLYRSEIDFTSSDDDEIKS